MNKRRYKEYKKESVLSDNDKEKKTLDAIQTVVCKSKNTKSKEIIEKSLWNVDTKH